MKKHIALFLFVLFIVVGSLISMDWKTVIQSNDRDNFRAERIHLLSVCIQMTTMPEYQPRYVWGREITYCNIAARDLLDNREHKKWKDWFGTFIDDYHYCVQSVFPSPLSILGTRIDTAYHRASRAAAMRCITEVTPSQAQSWANRGIAIWVVSARYTHEAIVCPDDQAYNADRGVLLAQVGRYCGIFYARDTHAFGSAWRDKEIKFYKFPGY